MLGYFQKQLGKEQGQGVEKRMEWGKKKKKQPTFPGGSDSIDSDCNAGDVGLIPQSGRSPGEAKGNPSRDSCLENFMDRGAWWATAHGLQRVRHD